MSNSSVTVARAGMYIRWGLKNIKFRPSDINVPRDNIRPERVMPINEIVISKTIDAAQAIKAADTRFFF
jgi:hypothetical protein